MVKYVHIIIGVKLTTIKMLCIRKCDFWQCNLTEYSSEEQLLNDPDDTFIFQEQEQPMSFNKNIKMGVIIQLRSKNDTSNEYGCKYIYPPHLNFTLNQ